MMHVRFQEIPGNAFFMSAALLHTIVRNARHLDLRVVKIHLSTCNTLSCLLMSVHFQR